MSRTSRPALLFHPDASGSDTALSLGDLFPECGQDLHVQALEQQLPLTSPLALHDRRDHCLADLKVDETDSDVVMHNSTDEHRVDAMWDNSRLALNTLGLGLGPLDKRGHHKPFDLASSDHEPTPLPTYLEDIHFSGIARPNVASSLNFFHRSCAAPQMPPSPPSPRRNLSKSITRNIPAGCKEVPWVEEEDDLSFWSPPTCCPSDHPLGTSSISAHAGEQQPHGDASTPLCPLTTTAPPLCPLASPPPSPHRKALTLPVAPPAPPATLAREPSSALKLKSTASSSSGRRSSRARPERRSTGDSRGRGREPGSSLDRRRVTSRSPPRRTSIGGSLKISKSTLSVTCSLGRREETLWPRPFDDASPEDPRSSSPVVSDEEDDDDSDEYDARFVDLAVIRRSLRRQGSQSPHKPTSSLQTHPMIDGLSNDPHASASPPRRRHRRLEKLHSEQWFLFAVAGAKEQRTGLGYWSHFDFDLS